MTNWTDRFFKLAKEVATWSKDPDCKVGVVIVSPDRRLFTPGYNGFPIGIADNKNRLTTKSVKSKYMVHAELNAILNARRDLTGWILFSTKTPCLDCARAIIQAGIKSVWCPEIDANSSWCEENNEALGLLKEAHIDTFLIPEDDFESV